MPVNGALNVISRFNDEDSLYVYMASLRDASMEIFLNLHVRLFGVRSIFLYFLFFYLS